MSVGLCEKADGTSHVGASYRHCGHNPSYHRFLKRAKNRAERRRAKQDPECVPGYGRYHGWET